MDIEVLSKRNKKIVLVASIIILFAIICSVVVEFNFVDSFTTIPEALAWMFSEFLPNKESLSKIPNIVSKLKETVLLSIAATSTAAIIALFMGVIGSKVTRINGLLSVISRGIASVSRNIPDAVWSMIFILSFGQNILTGYFALFFVSLGVLTRAFIETMDEASISAVEGLESTGASKLQIVFKGIIPSSMPQIISWILYMIETNIRSSTLIGMLTGTGIGFIFDLYYKSMNYSAASLVVISIIITVIIIEFISNKIRRVVI